MSFGFYLIILLIPFFEAFIKLFLVYKNSEAKIY